MSVTLLTQLKGPVTYMLKQKVDANRSYFHNSVLLFLENALNVRLKDAERAKRTFVFHHSLDLRDSLKLLHRKFSYCLNELVLGDI